jgi:hypothetical protein
MRTDRAVALLALASASLDWQRLPAQPVNPGITAVPARIVAGLGPGNSSSGGGYMVASLVDPVAEINDRLPPWIRFSGLERLRFEGYHGLGYRSTAASDDDYLLMRFRFAMTLTPAPWLKLHSELQDSRVAWKKPPIAPPNENTWDLRQAFVEFGEGEDPAFRLSVGRQEVNFGAGRLIGRSDWRNAGRTFDAALASLRLYRLRMTAFSLSVVVPRSHGMSHHQSGAVIHGLYGGIDNLVPHSVLEPAVFWRLAPDYRTDAGSPAKLDEKTLSLRWAGMVTRQFDYSAETAAQTGHLGSDSVSAWLLSLVGGYTVPWLAGTPRFFAEYFFASGDGSPKDGHQNTWRHLHPTHHDRNGLADQIGFQNLRELRTGVRLSPARHWVVAAVVSDWHLANSKDALYDTSGNVVARDITGRAGDHVGVELDLEMSYRLNREVELCAGIGRIAPGAFLKKTTPGKPYTYPYFGLTYSF